MKLKELQSLYDNISALVDHISVEGIPRGKKEAELVWMINERAEELMSVADEAYYDTEDADEIEDDLETD